MHTRAVHPPAPEDQPGEPVAPVLDPSSTYSFDETNVFATASAEKVGGGYVYSRWANPTVDAFEAAVADLEGTEEAEATASGMAAISTTLLALCRAGDRVVAVGGLYGGTFSVLSHLLPRYGIDATLLEAPTHEELKHVLDGARALYCETIANPKVQLSDVASLTASARDAGVPSVVDNTFASPILYRPAEAGATYVVHSATKYLGGHHDLLGGVVCASSSDLEPVRALARELGPTLSPFNAWLALRGIATLPLRVERSSATAGRVAGWLAEREDVAAAHHPSLATGTSKALFETMLSGRGGGTLAFELDGGRERCARFQEALKLIRPAASLGGTHSLMVHPASVTHTQLTAEELRRAEISEGFCRLSVGLEDPDDLIHDLAQALGATAPG